MDVDCRETAQNKINYMTQKHLKLGILYTNKYQFFLLMTLTLFPTQNDYSGIIITLVQEIPSHSFHASQQTTNTHSFLFDTMQHFHTHDRFDIDRSVGSNSNRCSRPGQQRMRMFIGIYLRTTGQRRMRSSRIRAYE